MNVLVVTTSYPRNDNDPSGIFIKRLTIAMRKAGLQVTVLAPGDKNAVRRESKSDIEVVRFTYAPKSFMKIGYGDGGIPENLRRWPFLWILIPFFIFSLVLHVIILAKRCDVIHANWLYTGLLSMPAKLIMKKPLVLTIRGSDMRKGSFKLIYLVKQYLDAITTVNKQWSLDLKDNFGIKSDYIPNGVEISNSNIDLRKKYSIGDDKIIALFIGALRKVKGADVLSAASKIVMPLNSRLQFLVIGPGDPETFGLNNQPNVICTGEIAPHEALGIFQQCDLFILPSRSEGRPNALLEAMASGIPSVATRLPGVIEVLTEQSGVLVEMDNPYELANAICLLAQSKEMRKSMGTKAKKRIAELSFTWLSSANSYRCVFEKAITGKNSILYADMESK